MSRTLRKRCRCFWYKEHFYKKVFRDSKGINVKGPHFYRQWFTKAHRLEWNKVLRNKNFDYDNFIAPIREINYWW